MTAGSDAYEPNHHAESVRLLALADEGELTDLSAWRTHAAMVEALLALSTCDCSTSPRGES